MEDTRFTLFTKTETAWEAMLSDCEHATKTIDMERYIFCIDGIGRRFLDLFIKKAKEGVRVRILVDMVGSLGFYLSSLPRELKDAGIEVVFWNPIKLWRIHNISSHFLRDHRKLLIVDNQIGYIGGTGVDDKTALWRDTEVRFLGDIVKDLSLEFERMWIRTMTDKRFKRSRRTKEEPLFEILSNEPAFRKRYLYRSYLKAIRRAKERIYLTSPYFIPDLRFLSALRQRAMRGVDVRLLVPHTSDHSFIDNSTRSYFTLAMKAKIRIYRYIPTMLHAKTAVIDEAWGTAGTFNLDNLSFLFNHEANVVSRDAAFIDLLAKSFMEDLKNAEEIVFNQWIQRSYVSKIKEFVTWPFHKLF